MTKAGPVLTWASTAKSFQTVVAMPVKTVAQIVPANVDGTKED